MRLLPVRHPDLGGGACSRNNPKPSRADIIAALDPHLCRCGIHNRVIRAVQKAGAAIAGARSHDLQHAAAEPDRQSDPVAMDRVRGEGPRPRRHRQGRDRPGHPDRAHADRRRRARRAAGADQSRLRPDRRQPGRGLHLGQLFDRGRRRLDPAGLRRGALAVPRSRRRDAAAARSASFRSRTASSCAPARTPATTTGRWRATSGSNAAPRGTAPVKRPSTYKIVGKHLPRLDLPAKVAGAASSTTSRPRTCCTPACCASPGAARISRRSTRARCARPPGRRSTSCARASSSPSPPTSELAVMRAAEGRPRRSRNGTAARRRPPTSARRTG